MVVIFIYIIENFGFEDINPETAVIDIKGNIWFGTKNQILKFDGSKLTCFNNVYEAELKNLNLIQDHMILTFIHVLKKYFV